MIPPLRLAPFVGGRACIISLALLLLTPRAAAESGISYKFADYQEAAGRVRVQTHGANLEGDFGPATRVRVEGVLDAIAGATPSGQPAPAGSDQVPLSQLVEYRKAWNAEFARQFRRVNLAFGAGNSRESDYVSTGLSLNAVFDFNQKNTNVLAGIAGTDDAIRVFYQPARAEKRTHDLIVGVTQLLDPNTSVGLNVTWGRQRGYLSDPYKLVQKNTPIFPGVVLPLTFAENRPGEREKWIALATLNRAFPKTRGAVDLTYRYYRDTYGTLAHTLEAAWFQRCGEKFVLRPSLRLYRQSAADFYHYRLDGTAVVPVPGPPRPQGPFYSSDYRLSAMRTWTAGLKGVYQANEHFAVDAAIERYEMRGRDGVTPASAYCEALIFTVGAKFSL